jgi:hypothetical protein
MATKKTSPLRRLLLVLLPVAFIITVSGSASAQIDADVCRIPVRISPDIRGVQLGMQLEEVKRQFHDSLGFALAPKPDETGVIDSVNLSLLDWYDKGDAFKGVEAMALIFTDGRVSAIGVAYNADTKWPTVNDFTSQISKTLALPSSWQKPTNADPAVARVMYCDGFRVIANIGGKGPSFIGLVDTDAEKTVKVRREEIEEKKRRAFKP